MTVVTSLLASALAAQTPALDAAERPIAAVLILAPGNSDAEIEARVLAAATSALHAHSGLTPVLAQALGARAHAISGCAPQRLLSCAVDIVAARGADVGVLLLVSVLAVDGQRSLVRAVAIDQAAAISALQAPRQDDDEATVDNRLYGLAIEGEPTEVDVSDVGALTAVFAAHATQLRARIPAAQPIGAIAMVLPGPAQALALDDRLLGPAAAGALEIVNVRPGPRTLRVVDALGRASDYPLQVASGEHATIALRALPLAPDASVDWRTTRAAVRWSGVALGTAGVVLGIVAATSGQGVRAGCLGRASASAPSCAGLGATSFAFDAGAAPSTRPADINPSSIAPLPLGAGLLAAGASWALGTLWWGDERDHPWWIVAGGVALGALSFGAMALAAP